MKKDDLGIKIISKEKKFWTDAKERCINAINEHESVLKLENAMLETINKKLKETE